MIVASAFRPAWWLPGPHLQTLWPTLVRRRPAVPLARERLELPDGDYLDLVWTPEARGPLVLVLHGLEGSCTSPYAAGLLHALHRRGFRAVLMHFRGCSGAPNRLPRSYHSGETGDLGHVAALLARRFPDRHRAVVGFSLGGNVLLKWLGEYGDRAPVQAAVAVSVPFVLQAAAARLDRGFSRLYQHHLLARLKASVQRKFSGSALRAPIAADELRAVRCFRDFDDRITAPLHGFRDAEDYYTRSSSRPYLARIRVPTLILHALDDPFLTPQAVPSEAELAADVTLELSVGGGHVGFVGGALPWRPHYWLEQRIPDYLEDRLGPFHRRPRTRNRSANERE